MTKRIINQNKVKINDIAVKNFNIKINFEKIIADAKNACEGIQLSKDSSKYLHNYSDKNSKRNKKTKPIVNNINYNVQETIKQQAKQKTKTLQKQQKQKYNFYNKK